jgi:predicted Fe-Mo cluster-binding NifX family protein
MSKIGVMMSADRADGQMSAHFGNAEWIMVAETGNQTLAFVKNDGLNGKSAAEIVISQGCTDVILIDIGDGALGHLQAAHINAWVVPALVAGGEALQMFKEGQLAPVPTTQTATRHGEGHGCCCANRTGSEASSCCRG